MSDIDTAAIRKRARDFEFDSGYSTATVVKLCDALDAANAQNVQWERRFSDKCEWCNGGGSFANTAPRGRGIGGQTITTCPVCGGTGLGETARAKKGLDAANKRIEELTEGLRELARVAESSSLRETPDEQVAEDFRNSCEYAWTIIANANGGNWDEATDEWSEAATRWRDEYHALLLKHPKGDTE